MRIWKTLSMRVTVMTRSDGCRVWDSDGKSYLNLQNSTFLHFLFLV